MPRVTLGALAMSGTMVLSAALAQEHTIATTGNLATEFYVKPSCEKPERISLRKPATTERDDVLRYNTAVKRYNKQLTDFGACIDAYVQKVPNDIDWITFMVNTAAAQANGSNPPPRPTVAGNMPLGFYPPPDCIQPDRKPGTAPDVRNVKAMGAHNTDVRTFNALANDFNGCIKAYVVQAKIDIEHVEKAQRDAALEARDP